MKNIILWFINLNIIKKNLGVTPCLKFNIVDYMQKNNNSFFKTLKNLDDFFYCKNYMKIIKPHLKGYAFIDKNNINKNIPYHKYKDSDEYFEAFKYHKNSKEFNIRALAFLI